MSLSAIGPISHAASAPQVQPAAPAPTESKSAPASLQPDTVTLSAAAQQPAQGGDVDHDGDSH